MQVECKVIIGIIKNITKEILCQVYLYAITKEKKKDKPQNHKMSAQASNSLGLG